MLQSYTQVKVCELHIQEEVWYFQENEIKVRLSFYDSNDQLL